jgi:hypothetical protein
MSTLLAEYHPLDWLKRIPYNPASLGQGALFSMISVRATGLLLALTTALSSLVLAAGPPAATAAQAVPASADIPPCDGTPQELCHDQGTIYRHGALACPDGLSNPGNYTCVHPATGEIRPALTIGDLSPAPSPGNQSPAPAFMPPGGAPCKPIAVWPSDVLPYAAPEPGLPAELQAFLGAWEGTWIGTPGGLSGQGVRLRVRDINRDTAGLAYAVGTTSAQGGSVSRRRVTVRADYALTWTVETALTAHYYFMMQGDLHTIQAVREMDQRYISKATLTRCSLG